MQNGIKESEIVLSVQAFCKVKDEIWFVPRNFNALFRMNCKDRKLIYVLEFEMESKVKQNLVKGIVGYGNELWFLPSEAKRIYVLNLEDMQMQSLELPAEYQGNKYKTGAYCAEGKYIWVLPFGTACGYRIDMQDKCVESQPNLGYPKNRKAAYMYCAQLGGKIVAVDRLSGQLLCYDSCLDVSKFTEFDLQKNLSREWEILAYRERFYLFSAEKVLLFDSKMELLEEKSLPVETKGMDVLDYLTDGDDIWLSCYPDFILCWNLQSDKITKHELAHRHPVRSAAMLGEIGCGVLFQDEEKVYCLPGDYGYFIEIDKKTQQKHEFPFFKEFDWVYRYLAADKQNQESRSFFFMNFIPTLEQFLQFVKRVKMSINKECQMEKAKEFFGGMDGKVGKAIVDDITRELPKEFWGIRDSQ